MELFELTEDDHAVVGLAINVAYRLLKNNPTPQQIIGLGHALYALYRLPDVTPSIYCEYGISLRAGDEDFSEVRYVDFMLTESSFEVPMGGSVYQKGIGSDSYSDPGWMIEVGGYRNTECDICELIDLEDTIEEYLNLGATISVSDESDIEFDE